MRPPAACMNAAGSTGPALAFLDPVSGLRPWARARSPTRRTTDHTEGVRVRVRPAFARSSHACIGAACGSGFMVLRQWVETPTGAATWSRDGPERGSFSTAPRNPSQPRFSRERPVRGRRRGPRHRTTDDAASTRPLLGGSSGRRRGVNWMPAPRDDSARHRVGGLATSSTLADRRSPARCRRARSRATRRVHRWVTSRMADSVGGKTVLTKVTLLMYGRFE